VALAGAGGVAAVAIAAGGGDPARPARAATPVAGTTATVQRRDLVDRESLTGTLGYADAGKLLGAAAGTVTWLPAAGTVVRRGQRLYDVDGEPAAFLLYGRLPAWRDLGPGVTDGEDVRQLERNLRALGDDTLDVDDHWDAATTAAVRRFQDARGIAEDGALARGQLVVRRGPTRIGAVRATLGDPSGPGRELAAVSSTRRQVTVDLDATRQSLAREGDRVTVDLPTGRRARGRITDVARVADPPAEEGGTATVAVTIALRGRAARGTGLDQAPVDVGFAVERRKAVLTVPVKALLAVQGGGFAIELAGGRRVRVTPGLYADDRVEVEGDLGEGQRVVSAR
jgi:peptidoglycan hydrolase-like protein with peptidoglycan-binding domain